MAIRQQGPRLHLITNPKQREIFIGFFDGSDSLTASSRTDRRGRACAGSMEGEAESEEPDSPSMTTTPPVIPTVTTPIAEPMPAAQSEATPETPESNWDRTSAESKRPPERTKKGRRRRLPDTGAAMSSQSEPPDATGTEGANSGPRPQTSYWDRSPRSQAPPPAGDLGDRSSEASDKTASGNAARGTRRVADIVAAPSKSSESNGSNGAGYWAKLPRTSDAVATVAGLREPPGTIGSADGPKSNDTFWEMPWNVEDAPDVARVFCAFVDNDAGYLGWLARHHSGFVLNCHREPGPDYLLLHRATCPVISARATKGRSRTRDPIKVCATWRRDLEAWADSRVAFAPKPCRRCLGGI
jgi:hypothetical protein